MTLFSGVVSTTAVPLAVMAGAVVADRSGVDTSIFGGTVACDYKSMAPWFAGTRRTRGRVLIDGEDITGLIGHITINEQDDAITRIATFRVLDPRASFWNSASITRGGRAVKIYLACDDFDTFSEVLEFTGVTDSAPAEGPYCPLATFRCVSLAGTLLSATTGCVQIAAFSGMRRRDILIAYALSAGVVLTLPAGVFMTKVQKPYNISGISIEALFLRYCEVEGQYVRELGDGTTYEIFDWAAVGPDAAAFINITEDMYLGSPREDTPNRPVTLLTVGGSGISQARRGPENPITTLDEHASGVDASGNPWSIDLWVTRQYGVELKSVREDRKVYARLGVATSPATLQLVSRQTTTTSYVMANMYGIPANEPTWAADGWQLAIAPITGERSYYFIAPTAQVATVTDVIEGWFSPLVDVTHGSLWTDNTHHNDVVENFQETARTVTTNTYDATSCRLSRQLAITQGWYVPQLDTPTFYLYDDGTYRNGVQQTYREVKRVDETYSDNLAIAEAGGTSTRVNRHSTVKSAWIITAWAAYGAPPVQLPTESYAVSEATIVLLTGSIGSASHTETTISNVTNGATSSDRKNVAGSVPDPQVASSTTPQFQLTAITATFSAYTDIFPIVPMTENNEDAETLAELEKVARYRLRKQLAVRETVALPAIRGLRALHPMTLTAPERSLSAKQCHVEKLTRDFDTLNGWMGMQATFAIDPAGV